MSGTPIKQDRNNNPTMNRKSLEFEMRASKAKVFAKGAETNQINLEDNR